jgi:hypothetical protein
MSVRTRLVSTTPKPIRRALKTAIRAVYVMPTSPARLLPDFLIIGAQRSGTTSLYNDLAQHPAVGPLVLEKGAHYFSTNYDKSLGWYRSHFPLKWRAAAERRRGRPFMTGEGSPYYVFHPLAAQRVGETLPHVKLLLMLRDPVQRAYSQYRHEVARGFEHLPTFEEAIDAEPERLAGERERIIEDPSYHSFEHQHHSYLARGRYLEQILRWRSLFPPEQMLIIKSEDFFSQPEPSFANVLEFLDLPPWRPKSFRRYNAARPAAMEPATRERLERYFAGPNRALADHLETELGWSS